MFGVEAGFNGKLSLHTEDGYKMVSCKVTVSQDPEMVYNVIFSRGKDSSGKRPSALSVIAGILVALLENPYTKEGYHFIGWTDRKNTYEASISYRIPYRDVILTTSWDRDERQKYTIFTSCQAAVLRQRVR